MNSSMTTSTQNLLVHAAAVVAIAVLATSFLVTRDVGKSFVFDDWTFISTRQNLGLTSLLQNHYGHFILIPAFIHILMYKTFGLGHYEVFRLLAPIWHIATVLAVGEMVRRRHGVIPAYLGAFLVAVSGVGAQNYFRSFQIGFMGSLLFFVLAVMSFDNAVQNNQLRWRFATFIAISLSVASSGSGIATLGAMSLLILSTRKWRLWWWVVLTPIMMFVGWFVKFGDIGKLPRPSIGQFLDFIFLGLSGTLSGMAGVSLGWGKFALILIAFLVLFDLQKHGFSLRRSIWLMFLLGFWCMTAYQRAGIPGFSMPLSSRYLWIGTFMFVMIVSEVVPRERNWYVNSKLLVTVGIVLVLLASWNSQPLRRDAQNFQKAIAAQSMVFNSLALNNRANIDPSTPIHALGDRIPYDTAAGFFQAVDKFGEPSQFAKKTIIDTDSLQSIADKAMSDLGLIDLKSVPGSCKSIGLTTNFILVEEGKIVKFLLEEKQTVSITRFLEPSEAVASNKQEILPGVHTVSLALDGFDRPLTLTFDQQIAICD